MEKKKEGKREKKGKRVKQTASCSSTFPFHVHEKKRMKRKKKTG